MIVSGPNQSIEINRVLRRGRLTDPCEKPASQPATGRADEYRPCQNFRNFHLGTRVDSVS